MTDLYLVPLMPIPSYPRTPDVPDGRPKTLRMNSSGQVYLTHLLGLESLAELFKWSDGVIACGDTMDVANAIRQHFLDYPPDGKTRSTSMDHCGFWLTQADCWYYSGGFKVV